MQTKTKWVSWKRYTQADLEMRVSHQQSSSIACSLIGRAYFKAEDKDRPSIPYSVYYPWSMIYLQISSW